jgi:hypothetical protein
MSRSEVTVRVFAVSVVVCDDRGTIVDRDGRVLARDIVLDRLRPLENERKLLDAMQWITAARRMQQSLARRTNRRLAEKDPWKRKAENLAASFRRRSLDNVRPKDRGRFEQYRTTTWDEAVRRLWQQGHNRFRYFNRSGWNRWSYTVSNNHNKKSGGRYAKTAHRNGTADSQSDQAARLPVRTDRTSFDS